MISAAVSLGYDNPPERIEELLLGAARTAGLQDACVRILDLKDFAVEYRVMGFLADVKQLLITRSTLRREMLTTLHAAKIEIASPELMIQRRIPSEQRILPPVSAASNEAERKPDSTAESRAFDKAEKASRLEQLRQLHEELQTQVKDLEKELHEPPPEDQARLEDELARVRTRLEKLESAWEVIEEKLGT